MSVTYDDDEWRKRITTIAMAGDPVVLIDNVDGEIGSPNLASVLTTLVWTDRILRRNEKQHLPLRTVWLSTGNGLAFRGDLGRRVVPIDLDAAVEHPEDRAFRRADLRAYVAARRTEIYSAALLILRAYHVAGRPPHGASRIGSFEKWDDLVRGALVWLGQADPLGGRERIRAEGDSDLDTRRALYNAMRSTPPRTSLEIVAHSAHKAELASALADLTRGKVAALEARRVGRALAKYKDRIVDGRKLVRTEDAHAKIARWHIEEIG